MAHRTAQAKENHGGNYIAGGTQGSKSVLDLAAHTTLKKRRIVAVPTLDVVTSPVPPVPTTTIHAIDTSDDDDDEDALQAEIEALRKAKLVARKTTAPTSAPIASTATPPPSSVGVQQPLWMDDGMFRGNATKASLQEGSGSAPPNRFINDPLHNDFHKRFMDKLFK